MMKDLDSPCKNTCSGWNQGFERGQAYRDAEIADLETKLAVAVEALEYYGSEVIWQDYYYDAGDDPGDIQMAIDFDDVDYRQDEDGEITWACAGKKARTTLQKIRGDK